MNVSMLDALLRDPLPLLQDAARRIASHAHRTPLLRCRSLSRLAGCEIHLKAECWQRGGSFKLRGAMTRATSLEASDRARGLITYSSGNHAQATGLVASILGVPAMVVMPRDALAVKQAAVRGYGAEVVLEGLTSEDRRLRAEALASERGLAMIRPFDHPDIVRGQGTVGLEIAEDLPDLAAVFVPIGGGGLISGVSLAVKALVPTAQVIGVEAEGAARAARSLAEGRRVFLDEARTVADGARPLALGELNWEIVRRRVDQVVTVPDSAILEALELLLTRAKLVAEPTGALALAGALHGDVTLGDGPVAVVVSGGNLDVAPLMGALSARA
jgi:threonine dehydratase